MRKIILWLLLYLFIIDQVSATSLTAHRGASIKYSENTVSAFVYAALMQSGWIELDVQQTADGKIVVTHDKNIYRITNIDKNIIDLTYDDLSILNFDYLKNTLIKKETIPLLEDVIKYAKNNNIRLNIELKVTGHEKDFERQVIECIKKYDYMDMSIISTNSYKIVKKIKEIDNNIKVAYIVYKNIKNIEKYKLVDIFSIKYNYVDQDIINKIHFLGKEIYVWTVDNEEDIINMLEMNVDNIITNDIELAIKTKLKNEFLNFFERL